jgi:ElaB/YqjD/DUF883 family membrane-anchored ribosome-binding protein
MDRSYERTGEGQFGGYEGSGQRRDWTSGAGLTERAREGVEQATEYMREAMGRTREKVAEYREAGAEQVKRDLINFTREQPITALLIAAGAGLLVGWLTMMSFRSSESSSVSSFQSEGFGAQRL